MSAIYDNLAGRVNSLLVESCKKGYDVTPLRLQKLLYLNYGMYLQTHDHFLPHLHFQAWRYGPVVREIYDYYKVFGSSPITKKVAGIDSGVYPRLIDDQTIQLTVNKYAGMDAFELVALTHRREGAWYKAFAKKVGAEIEHSDIKEEFTS